MEIRRIYTNYLHNSEKPVSKTGKPADESFAGKTGGSTEKADKIEISSNATFRSQLEAAKRTYAKKAGGEVSAQRLADLKMKYQDERSPVPAESVADAILNRVLGPDKR